MLKFIVFSIIALHCHQIYAANDAIDVILLLQANGTVDVDAIKQLSHTHSVYKVKALQFTRGWNFAVIAKGFTSQKARDTYVSAIQGLSSIEKTDPVDMKPYSSYTVMALNAFMRTAKAIGKIFGYLPSRPLKPQTPPVVKCDTVDIKTDEPMFVFAYMLPGDEAAMQKFGWITMTRILPVLDMKFLYQGVPKSDHWKLFNLQEYDSKKTFCEYMESELVIKYGELYTKAFKDQHSYTATKI